jgi:cell division protease FtsH
MNRVLRNTGFYLLIFLVLIGIVRFISNQNDLETEIKYNQFVKELKNSASETKGEKIESIAVKPEGYTYVIKGKYTTSGKTFRTRAPIDPSVVAMIQTSGVDVAWQKMEGDSIWLSS